MRLGFFTQLLRCMTVNRHRTKSRFSRPMALLRMLIELGLATRLQPLLWRAQVSYGRPSLRLPYLQTPGVEWAAVTASGVRHPHACGEVPDGETVIKLPPLLGPYDASEAVGVHCRVTSKVC